LLVVKAAKPEPKTKLINRAIIGINKNLCISYLFKETYI
jgi:hypothetical protein